MYQAYAKFNNLGCVIDIGSNINIINPDGWELIDEGDESKYARAQVDYFDKPITNDNGTHNYRRGNPTRESTAEELTTELAEIEAARLPIEPTPIESLQTENKLLKAQMQAQADRQDFVEDCIAEMVMQLYA